MGNKDSEVHKLFGQVQSYAALAYSHNSAETVSDLLALLVPGDFWATLENLKRRFPDTVSAVEMQNGNVALAVYSWYVQQLRDHLERCHLQPVTIPLADIYLLARSRNRAVQLAA